MRPSFIKPALWLTVLQSALLCSRKCCITASISTEPTEDCSSSHALCKSGARVSGVIILFYFSRGRCNQNHPGASGHGDHCRWKHCITLPGRQWPCPWCFFLLGLQWTADRQGRWSLWACGRGEWPIVLLFQNVQMDIWRLFPSCFTPSRLLVKRNSLRFDIMVFLGRIYLLQLVCYQSQKSPLRDKKLCGNVKNLGKEVQIDQLRPLRFRPRFCEWK